MTYRNVAEAKAELSSLLALVEKGEEVVISRAGKPIAKLVPINALKEERKSPCPGGEFWMSPDFNAPEPELERLFYGEAQDLDGGSQTLPKER